MALLMPAVEQLAGERDRDNVPAHAGLPAVLQARRRIREPEAAGLMGEVASVKRLTRCVVSSLRPLRRAHGASCSSNWRKCARETLDRAGWEQTARAS
ncbi:DUF6415 family natural product biosynthesis protein [Streptomyces nigra]